MLNEGFKKIDVRTIQTAERHPHIFSTFDKLEPGQGIMLLNDHDPKPLYFQMLAQRGLVFTWEYGEKGPEVWSVMIHKNTPLPKGSTIGEIAASDIRKAKMLAEKGIDICCGGKKTLRQVCSEMGLPVTEVEKELNTCTDKPDPESADFAAMPLSELCDYITSVHHAYINRSVPAVSNLAEKVKTVHLEQHGELELIISGFRMLAGELMAHLQKEERVLFPCIRKMEHAYNNRAQMDELPFGSVSTPVHIMEMEHESAGDLLKEIRELSNHYTAPADACESYKMLYRMLKEFEDDLHLHIHLENNILFPRCMKLEDKMREDRFLHVRDTSCQ